MKKKIWVTTIICFTNLTAFAACGTSTGNSPVVQTQTMESSETQTGSTENETKEKETVKQQDPAQIENAFKQMSEDMSRYIGVTLMTHWLENDTKIAQNIDIELTDAEKIRASALICEADGEIDSYFVEDDDKIRLDETASSGSDGNGYHGWSVSKENVEKNCLDLFGTEAVWDAFQTKEQNTGFDAVKYTDSTGVHTILLSDEMEDETDQKNQDYRIRIEEGKYLGEVDMYWGYWGYLQNDPGLSNYMVTYQLLPDEKSKYGMVIEAINIKKTDTDENADENPDSTVSSEASQGNYYGIFAAASKDIDECTKIVDKLKDAGFQSTYIIYTPDFSKLNQEPYYAVTTGFYPTEQAAEEILASVKANGFADAYVRYTGTYAGSDPYILDLIGADQKGADSGNPVDAITLNDALREKLAGHYQRILNPSGTFICFDMDDEVIENGYRTAIRYQMSDAEAEEAMANGSEVLPNRYAFTIEIDTSTGDVKMTDEDPFWNWSQGKDYSEYDWNLNEE